jgi:O-antigen ligase
MSLRRLWTPTTTRLLQLALALLVVQYMLLIGGSFGASIVFAAQRLNLVAGAILALGWLLVRLAQRRPLHLTGLEIPLLALILSQWLAVLTSTQPRLGLDWAASVTTWGLALFILADCLAGGWPRSFWMDAIIVAAAILAAHGVWSAEQWFAGWAARGTFPPVAFRYDGLLGQANLTAVVINLLWPIIIARLFQTRRRLSRLALGLLLVGLAITLFFTSSRGGWLAAGLSAGLLGALLVYARGGQAGLRALWARWQRFNALARMATVGVLVLMVLAAAWLLIKESQQITHGGIFEARSQFWSAAWELFKSRPLTGAGPGLFPWSYSRFDSIPPAFFAPHAHSLIFQTLSDSGLVGLAALLVFCAVLARRWWTLWQTNGRPVELMCLAVALAGFAIHGIFDYLLTAITFLLLVIIVALLLTAPAASRRGPPPLLAAPMVLLPIGVFALLLQGSASNDAALALAQSNQWAAAGHVFVQTAQSDPQLTLYWEEAAYAYTLAGEPGQALPLWDRAARDDPNWALVPATIGALRHDLASAQAARDLAPKSYLYALNAGAIAESQNNPAAAQEAYHAALDLKPAIAAALYWQQTPLRRTVLSAWRAQLPPDPSDLGQGLAALAQQSPQQAVTAFRRAIANAPSSLTAYVGLGQAFLQLGDSAAAQRAVQTGLDLPALSPEERLPLLMLAGEVAAARGDRAEAMANYSAVFGAIADYNISGPGSYGQTQRSWFVFHRAALPSELVPQLPRADITAEMDQRFAQLAQWYRDAGQAGRACSVLARVYQEAPDSVSGHQYVSACPH